MESLSTSAIGYLVAAIKENKELKQFGNDFLGAFVHWVRPLFLKDDETEKDALANLKVEPDDKFNQQAAANEVERHLEKHPEAGVQLKSLLQTLKAQNIAPAATYITFQHHTGSGDNVVNKIG